MEVEKTWQVKKYKKYISNNQRMNGQTDKGKQETKMSHSFQDLNGEKNL